MPEDSRKYLIKKYVHWEVYLHKNQYYLGRTYIWAKREDALDFMQMTPEETEELFIVGREVNRALAELFKPDLTNYIVQANVSNHLHLHLIPRYKTARKFGGMEFIDERWGKNYAPYNYDFKIPEPTLLKIRDAIKEKL